MSEPRTWRICSRCFGVEGMDWGMGTVCRVGKATQNRKPVQLGHDWQAAAVEDCPFMVRTPTGRVSDKARQRADRACVEAGNDDLHHYGDPQRRHFSVLVNV